MAAALCGDDRRLLGDVETVVVTAPLAACKHGLRNLLHCKVREVRLAPEGAAADEQRALGTHLLADEAELVGAQVLGGHVDEVALGRVTVIPEDFAVRRVAEAFELAHRLGEHLRLVLLADDPVAPLVLLKERGRELEEAEATTTFPVGTRSDTSGI